MRLGVCSKSNEFWCIPVHTRTYRLRDTSVHPSALGPGTAPMLGCRGLTLLPLISRSLLGAPAPGPTKCCGVGVDDSTQREKHVLLLGDWDGSVRYWCQLFLPSTAYPGFVVRRVRWLSCTFHRRALGARMLASCARVQVCTTVRPFHRGAKDR